MGITLTLFPPSPSCKSEVDEEVYSWLGGRGVRRYGRKSGLVYSPLYINYYETTQQATTNSISMFFLSCCGFGCHGVSLLSLASRSINLLSLIGILEANNLPPLLSGPDFLSSTL